MPHQMSIPEYLLQCAEQAKVDARQSLQVENFTVSFMALAGQYARYVGLIDEWRVAMGRKIA